jgi:hypothetical protein
MARGTVRTHTRRMPDGTTRTVHQHTRRGRPRGLSPKHAGKLARRAFRNWGRKKRATALLFGGLALGEFGAWLGLRGAFFMLTTVALLAIGAAALAAAASGGEPGSVGKRKSTPARRAPRRGQRTKRPSGDGGGDGS